MKRVIDARGQKCPKPLMMVKEALKEMNDGENALIVLGSANARNNVEKLLTDHSIIFKTEVKSDCFEINITKSSQAKEIQNAQEYCNESGCKK